MASYESTRSARPRPGVAVGADRQAGQQRRAEPVPHRVEQRHVQPPVVERVVERVAADLVPRLQQSGQRDPAARTVVGGSSRHWISAGSRIGRTRRTSSNTSPYATVVATASRPGRRTARRRASRRRPRRRAATDGLQHAEPLAALAQRQPQPPGRLSVPSAVSGCRSGMPARPACRPRRAAAAPACPRTGPASAGSGRSRRGRSPRRPDRPPPAASATSGRAARGRRRGPAHQFAEDGVGSGSMSLTIGANRALAVPS
jgi:hypothetical protein